MKIVPQQWTHYHTQRLYHISRLATFIFIIVLLIMGVVFVFGQLRADEQHDFPLSLSITALVPGATETPAVPQPRGVPDGGVYPPLPPENPKPAPGRFVTIVAENSQKKVFPGENGEKILVDVFSTQFPKFSGTTNIPNALIFIEIKNQISIRSTTMADKNGFWQWTARQPLFSGANVINVAAQNSEKSQEVAFASLNFFVELDVKAQPQKFFSSVPNFSNLTYGANPFDVVANIPEQFRTVDAGGELVANIRLINFGKPSAPRDVQVEYLIQNSHGEVVLRSAEILSVPGELSYLKTFFTSAQLSSGAYLLTVTVPSKEMVATSSDVFKIQKKAIVASAEEKNKDDVSPVAVVQGFAVMLFLFGIVAYFEYDKIALLSLNIKKIGDGELKAMP